MLLHPEAQKRAQAELDGLLGNGRLPSFEDRRLLPYFNSVYLETLRWYPVVPLGKLTSLQNVFLDANN